MNTTESPGRLLTTAQAAEFLNISPGTLSNWRCTGRYALPWVAVGRRVRYRPQDLEQFLRLRTNVAAAS